MQTPPRIECVPLPSTETLDGRTAAGIDAAILMLEAVTDETFAAGDRLAVLARFGVGYDRIQVPACTAHATALCIAPDGVRRPVAVAVDVAAVKAVMTGHAPKDVVNASVLEDPRFSRRLARYGEAFG